MAGKVISIEIGNILTKVCEMDYRSKNTKVYNSFVFETPKGTVEDGYIREPDDFIDMLHAKLAANQIKTKKVVFSISSSKIANREVFLPLVSKDKIMSMVKANASDYFPMDISNYFLTYNVLEKVVDKDEKKLKLLLIAAPLDLLEGYFDLARVLGLTIASIDYTGNSVFQVVSALKKQNTNISIHIGETSTIVTIMENGVLALQRIVSYGANGAIDTLLSIDKYRYDETFDEQQAYELFMSQQMINAVIPDEDAMNDSDLLTEDERIRNEVTESLRFLLGNIVRVIDYYMSRTAAAKIDMIYLSGVGAEFLGMRELFSFEIGSAVKAVTNLEGVNYEPNGGLDCYSVMLPVIGAAKHSMHLMPDAFKTKKVKNDSLTFSVCICLIGLAAAVGMWIIGGIMYDMAVNSTKDLENKKEELKPIEEVMVRYNNSTTTYNSFKEMMSTVKSPNKHLVAFINELERKMPKGFVTLDMNVSTAGVVMNITCTSKPELMAIIQQLRTFNSISVVGISDVKEDIVEQETEGTLGYIFDENGNMYPIYASQEATEASTVVVTDENGSEVTETETHEYLLSLSVSCVYNLDYLLSDEADLADPTFVETTVAASDK